MKRDDTTRSAEGAERGGWRRGVLRVMLAAATVPAAGAVVAPAVGASTVESATARTAQHAGAPATSPPEESFVSAVACSSPNACTAMGDYVTEGPILPEALRWNGLTWNKQDILSEGSAGTFLFGVSCDSATHCVAVGYYETASLSITPLAEVWNGTSWQVMPSPNPAGSSGGGLDAVSCLATTFCTVAGWYEVGNSVASTPLAEVWNGTSWSSETVPFPGAHEKDAEAILDAVSCWSRTACSAVGYHGDTNQAIQRPLAESWNGTTWSVQRVPFPAAAKARSSNLESISCASAASCVGLGYYGSGAKTIGVAVKWNGKRWSDLSIAAPHGGTLAFLNSISCVSSRWCAGVGSYHLATGYATLAETWNGHFWTIASTPNTVQKGNGLNAVSCTSTVACNAVGTAGSTKIGGLAKTIAEIWNGTDWALRRPPAP
jgi:hypothetical protein